VRVDEEHGEDLAVARLGLVFELETAKTMLHDVGKGEQPIVTRGDRAELLYRGAFVFDPVEFLGRAEFVLRAPLAPAIVIYRIMRRTDLIWPHSHGLRIYWLSELKTRCVFALEILNVAGIIVIESCRYDVLIETAC
jgi:hypothetical protein